MKFDMCDTFVAVGSATVDGSTIFGKNSDRPYKEVQNLIHVPHKAHSVDTLKCTYIEIPQVPETNEVLLCQPYWMWGAEIGANEFGVVIGNEAVYSKEPEGPPALLGMDLLRLGLERGRTARDALDTIANLLEEFGQGGGCSADDPSWSYHNSFIIADAKEAWVLETAGRWWIAERIQDSVRNISNGLSIRTKFDLTADGLIDYAVDKGYWDSSRSFDFAKAFSWDAISGKPSSFSREGRGRFLLEISKGSITPKTIMEILRDHDTGICMHGGFRSTASMVSRIDSTKELTVHWFTGTPYPCKSFFKPLFMSEIEIPTQFKANLTSDQQTLWWAHEIINEKAPNFLGTALIDIENHFLQRTKTLLETRERTDERKILFLDAFKAEWALLQRELRS